MTDHQMTINAVPDAAHARDAEIERAEFACRQALAENIRDHVAATEQAEAVRRLQDLRVTNAKRIEIAAIHDRHNRAEEGL